MTFVPLQQKEFSEFVRFEDAQGLVYEAHGNNPRLQLAYDIANSFDKEVVDKALGLLHDFIKHEGIFEPSFVIIFPDKDEDGCDFNVRFTLDDNTNNFDNTYFDVYLSARRDPDNNFWPIKFTAGFY